MERRPLAFLAAVIAAAAPARALQRGFEARTSLRLFAGAAANRPLLWSVPRQPILTPGTEASPRYDTLALARGFDPGIAFGVAFVHFPSARFGIAGRLSYVGLQMASRCSPVAIDTLVRDNAALCATIQGQQRGLGVMLLDLQGIARPLPRAAVNPAVHAGLAAATYSASTVYLEGAYPSGIRIVIDDPAPGSVAAGGSLGITLTTALGSGYQFAFDLTETWLGFPAVASAADPFAHAPTTTRYTGHLVFTFGLEFVLDGRRGRRY